MPNANPLRVKRQSVVTVHVSVLQGGNVEKVRLNLFEDMALTLAHNRTEFSGGGGYAWWGNVMGKAGAYAVLVANKDRLSGIIRLPDATYKIRPLGDGFHLLREIRPEAEPLFAALGPSVSTDESRVLQLVNAERGEAGLHGLTWNEQLFRAARHHALDMATQNYFSHTSQDGRSAGQRITAAGYQWQTYGENIAYGYSSPEAVMAGWMNSSGHRANILESDFCELGVGQADHANTGHRRYWTQDFGKSFSSDDCDHPTPANQLPVVRFTPQPVSGPAPLSVRFDASDSYDPDGTIVNYLWDFGDGESGSGDGVQHQYTNPGTYTVSLTLVDEDGGQAIQTATAPIEVHSPETITPDNTPMVPDEGGSSSSGCFINALAIRPSPLF